MVFTETFFENACKLWSRSLRYLELSIRFECDPRSTPSRDRSSKGCGNKAIKRLFLSLEKCRVLKVLKLDLMQRHCVSLKVVQSPQFSPNLYGHQRGQSGYDSRSSSGAQRRRSSVGIFGGGTPLPQLPQSLPTPHDHGVDQSPSSSHHDSGCN